jgi:methionyl aminopeptidase
VVTFGKTDIIIDGDGWTVRSADGSLVAHSERCILITETGHEILS